MLPRLETAAPSFRATALPQIDAQHDVAQARIAAGVIGFCSAFVLTSTLAAAAHAGQSHDVPRVAAAMFAIGYLCAIVTPVLGGFLWDLTGTAWTAFVPAGLFGPLMTWSGGCG